MAETLLPLKIISTLFKHKFKIIFTFLSTVTTVTIGTYMAKPTYETTSDLLIRFGREYLYSPAVDDDRSPYNYFNDKGVINTEIQIINSFDLVKNVITEIGLEKIYPPPPQEQGGIKKRIFNYIKKTLKSVGLDFFSGKAPEPPNEQNRLARAARQIRQLLVVRGDPAANIIHVSFTHSNPQITADVVNTLVELYKEKHLETFSESSEATAFFKKQVDIYYNKLLKSQKEFEGFQKENLTISPEKQQDLLLKQREKLKLDFFENELQVALKKEPLFANPERNEVVAKGKKELLRLKLEELELSDRYKKDTSKIITIRRQIELLENLLGEMPDKRIIKIRREKIKQQLKKVDKELLNLVLNGIEYHKLKDEVELYSERYQNYKKTLDDFLINDEMDRHKINNIRVIQKAPVPLDPILPRKEMNIASGAILGVILGACIALCAEYLSKKSINLKNNQLEIT